MKNISDLWEYSKEKADCGKIMLSLLEDTEIKNNMVLIGTRLTNDIHDKLPQLVLDVYFKAYTSAISDVMNDFM
jgi:hypothetical protein